MVTPVWDTIARYKRFFGGGRPVSSERAGVSSAGKGGKGNVQIQSSQPCPYLLKCLQTSHASHSNPTSALTLG